MISITYSPLPGPSTSFPTGSFLPLLGHVQVSPNLKKRKRKRNNNLSVLSLSPGRPKFLKELLYTWSWFPHFTLIPFLTAETSNLTVDTILVKVTITDSALINPMAVYGDLIQNTTLKQIFLGFCGCQLWTYLPPLGCFSSTLFAEVIFSHLSNVNILQTIH